MKLFKHSPRPKLIMLFLMLMLLLSACQKTTQFNYDSAGDPFVEAENVMNGLGANFNPAVEKIVVLAAAFNNDGIGMLQEHQLHDFSSITINSTPGGKIVISVPLDPSKPYHWRLILNESKKSSRPFVPTVLDKKADLIYDRLNYLIEPSFDTDITFVLEDDLGNRQVTFLAAIRGVDP